MKGVLIRDCALPGAGPASVYCEGGKIVRISPGREGESPSDVFVIEANGGTLLPGFADTHCHPFEYGWLKRSVDLRGTSNMTGVRMRVQAAVQRAKAGEWVTGMGWDQEAFPDGRMPTRADVDGVSPANPVALSRVCGHVALLNTRAVELLGISGRRGGEYEVDASGELTGIVKEGAMTDAYSHIQRTPESAASDLQAVEAEAARMGLTSLSCILSPEGFREELEALAALRGSRSLSLRYRVYVPPGAIDLIEEERTRERFSSGQVRICGVKIYTDGSLGARTAALREPYSDDPGNRGIMRLTDEELEREVALADSRGHQVIVHAIGDRGVEQAVDVLSKFSGGGNPLRHRVEHASLLPRDLRGKMAKNSLRAAVQPLFVTSDTWAAARLGEERVRDLYPFRSMLEDGIIASGSSDSPVESLSPILGVWAAMTRGGLSPEEALTEEQAMGLYTSGAASNSSEDGGARVEEGAPATLTLLDSDLEGMHPALLRKVGVLATLVEGAAAHSFGGP